MLRLVLSGVVHLNNSRDCSGHLGSPLAAQEASWAARDPRSKTGLIANFGPQIRQIRQIGPDPCFAEGNTR